MLHARTTYVPASLGNAPLWITRQLAAADAVAVDVEPEELDVDDELLAEVSDDEDLDSLLAPESLFAAASTLPERLSVR